LSRHRRSPLPPGCTFRIWPTYRLDYRGRSVKLGQIQASILLFLMSQPGRFFSALEIANAVYEEQESGGPESANTIGVMIHFLKRKLRRAGIDLRLKSPFTKIGYAYLGMTLIESPKKALERAGVRFHSLSAPAPEDRMTPGVSESTA
jgi:DNA-binding winged helix-turn-helix (wHTH) protein